MNNRGMNNPGVTKHRGAFRRPLSFVVAGFLLALSALGAGADDSALCDHSGDTPDASIPACTRLLDAARNETALLPAIYNNRGIGWVRKGLYASAIDDFNSAIQYDPKYVDAYRNRGLAWHISGDFDRALADFNQAIRLNANSAPLYNARGTTLLNKGELERAVVDFDKAISLDPRYASAFINRGLALHRKLEFDRAIADFNQVIAIIPKATAGYNNRAAVWMDKADFTAAISDYDAAIKLDPNDWRAYASRGEAWRLKGDLDRALADQNEAIKRDPTAVDAYNNRAIIWRDKGEFDRAIADYGEAILLNPRYDRAYANRGEIWRLRGNLDKSLADLNNALSLNPNYPIWLAYRGETLRLMGDLDHALADFNEALRILPTAVIAYTGRALTYESKGEEANARADYQKALRLSADIDASLARPAQQIARQRLAAIETAEQKRKEAAAAAANPPVDYGRRVALVIGNSGYRMVGSLPNAAADADALAKALRDTGFQVVMHERDLTREGMLSALRAFQDEAEHADWAVIYYSGHGIEVGGTNYMIPVDARLRTDRDVPDEAVSLDRVLVATEGARKLRLVVLDACRDNPFVPQMRRSVASRSIGRGLARVEPEGGTMVVYSAKEGQVALDGDGKNSPFLLALLNQIKKPNLEINKLFRFVRDEVLSMTGRRQEPFVYGSLPAEDFYFVMK